MTVHKSKNFKKLDKYTQQTLNIAIEKLTNRYDEYRKQNIVITNLFGDDVIVHDIINDDLYVYKCQARGIQIRLLYEVDSNNKINVLDFFIKNHDNKLKSYNTGKDSNKYLAMFKASAKNYERRALA